MSKGRRPSVTRVFATAILIALVVYMTAADYSAAELRGIAEVAVYLIVMASPVWGPIVAAVFIWRIVRWANQRDDLRFAKRPPDAP